MNKSVSPSRWYGIPRQDILWWPTVQSCNCQGCGLCVLACPQEALAYDYKLRLPFIRNTQSCLVGCTICGTICPFDGMLFPPRMGLRLLAMEHKIPQQARKSLSLYWKRFGGSLPVNRV